MYWNLTKNDASALFSEDTLRLCDKAVRELEEKRQTLTEVLFLKDAREDIYGGLAGIHISHGIRENEALSHLEKVGLWFEIPHPNGRDHKGECDFTARRLIRILYTLDKSLPADLLKTLQDFYTKHDFRSMYDSENHRLLYHTAKYLFAQRYPELLFEWCGLSGFDAVPEEEAYIKEFLRFRARHGWAEFDSCGYMSEIFACLYDLYDFAGDEEMRLLSRMTMDVLLLDMVSDSREGLYGGAHGRIYPNSALDHACDGTLGLYYLYFGHPYTDISKSHYPIEALFSSYIPSPVVYEIALGRNSTAYENLECGHLHLIPPFPRHEGYISKYTYVTPHYLLGAVNSQDDYPKASKARWYAHHQQHEWDLTFLGHTRARIFTHHPGTEPHSAHNEWTGDLGCGCVQTFCHKNAVLAVYDIAHGQNNSREDGKKQLEHIHAYVPKEVFDRVEELGSWLFVSFRGTHAGLWFSEGYTWASGENAGFEVLSFGARHACVCEASNEDESFESFVLRVTANPIAFNPSKMSLSYESGGKCLYMEARIRQVDGKEILFPYPLFESPYVKSELGSGVITAHGLTGCTVYDFIKLKQPMG